MILSFQCVCVLSNLINLNVTLTLGSYTQVLEYLIRNIQESYLYPVTSSNNQAYGQPYCLTSSVDFTKRGCGLKGVGVIHPTQVPTPFYVESLIVHFLFCRTNTHHQINISFKMSRGFNLILAPFSRDITQPALLDGESEREIRIFLPPQTDR